MLSSLKNSIGQTLGRGAENAAGDLKKIRDAMISLEDVVRDLVRDLKATREELGEVKALRAEVAALKARLDGMEGGGSGGSGGGGGTGTRAPQRTQAQEEERAKLEDDRAFSAETVTGAVMAGETEAAPAELAGLANALAEVMVGAASDPEPSVIPGNRSDVSSVIQTTAEPISAEPPTNGVSGPGISAKSPHSTNETVIHGPETVTEAGPVSVIHGRETVIQGPVSAVAPETSHAAEVQPSIADAVKLALKGGRMVHADMGSTDLASYIARAKANGRAIDSVSGGEGLNYAADGAAFWGPVDNESSRAKAAGHLLTIDQFECIACGTCVEQTDKVFFLPDGEKATPIAQDGPMDLIQDAIDECPVTCISWVNAQDAESRGLATGAEFCE